MKNLIETKLKDKSKVDQTNKNKKSKNPKKCFLPIFIKEFLKS